MNTQKKAEWKGMFKGIVVTLLLLGVFSAGVVYAGVTLMTDEGFFVNGNEVLIEEDFTTWTHKWTEDFPAGRYARDDLSFHIDEKNDVLVLSYYDDNNKAHFTIRNLADFSSVYDSGASFYTYIQADNDYARSITFGDAIAYSGGISKSIESYMLLLRSDQNTIEVWRGGASAVWSHDITNEVAADNVYSFIISPTGKWIVVNAFSAEKLICYEGS